jgi:predicted nucleotidyltransferase
MWIFGSRVRGTNRPDSDLDVAVELIGNGQFDAAGIFMQNQYPWMDELKAATGHAVHLTSWRAINKVPEDPPGSILLFSASVLEHEKPA